MQTLFVMMGGMVEHGRPPDAKEAGVKAKAEADAKEAEAKATAETDAKDFNNQLQENDSR